jgi:peptide/nickel transport system permease protein
LTLKVGAGLVAAVCVVAVVGPWLVGDPNEQALDARLVDIGTSGHLLGTDGLGRDLLARVVTGTRPSLLVGLIPVLCAGVLGLFLGLTAGLGQPRLRSFIMRATDVFYAFPVVLLAIGIAASLGPGISNAVIALTVAFTPPITRIVESETAQIADHDFMLSARATGASSTTIALRHVGPNIAAAVVAYCTTLVGIGIVYGAGLSLLGVGTSPPDSDWGLMVNHMQQYMFSRPALALVPAVAIFVASVAFNLFGDGMRDLFNVRRDLT